VLKPLGRTLELAQTYTEIGRNYAHRSDHEQAQRFYRAALKVHTELGDLNGMKNAYNNLGLALMRADRAEEAITAYQESLELKRRLGDRLGEGASLNNLGNLWYRKGEHRRAFQCYRRGIAIYRRLEQPRELATFYNNMGEVHRRLGSFPKALRLLGRAQWHAEGLGGAYIALVVAHNLGATHIDLLDPQAGIKTLSTMLPVVQRSRLRGLEAQYYATLALACTAAGDAARAPIHERLALETLSEVPEDESRFGALLDLAEAAALQARHDAVHEWALESEASSRSRPHPRARALRLLATACGLRGDWDVAEARLEEAVELCRSEGFRHELARCYKRLGFLHWDLGLRARAAEDFRRSIQLLTSLRLRTELGLMYLELARLGPGST
jgi:tetratricopeptide (TPR) repeat protein